MSYNAIPELRSFAVEIIENIDGVRLRADASTNDRTATYESPWEGFEKR